MVRVNWDLLTGRSSRWKVSESIACAVDDQRIFSLHQEVFSSRNKPNSLALMRSQIQKGAPWEEKPCIGRADVTSSVTTKESLEGAPWEVLIRSPAVIFARITTLYVSAMRRVHLRMRGLWSNLALLDRLCDFIGVGDDKTSDGCSSMAADGQASGLARRRGLIAHEQPEIWAGAVTSLLLPFSSAIFVQSGRRLRRPLVRVDATLGSDRWKPSRAPRRVAFWSTGIAPSSSGPDIASKTNERYSSMRRTSWRPRS
ncbi:hypothetical protein K458DRAFT_399416 [Lentithecium fluviatile CBS 122367]|uniref:Uncharacterized protein n=1 Tax=Lentithecium fluviatile CBS 122367 TaxID=1168545 RepID=A0A6G1JHH4_9PLEO|nr:hypothetical protein K458DRAFT_399416 [Lentithecium fluviatile CBS 122367]